MQAHDFFVKPSNGLYRGILHIKCIKTEYGWKIEPIWGGKKWILKKTSIIPCHWKNRNDLESCVKFDADDYNQVGNQA